MPKLPIKIEQAELVGVNLGQQFYIVLALLDILFYLQNSK